MFKSKGRRALEYSSSLSLCSQSGVRLGEWLGICMAVVLCSLYLL